MSKPQIIPVTSSIWCVRRVSYFTCSYVVRATAGTVLIDAGMDSGGRDMSYALEKLDLKPDTVKGILLTHWHNDHAAGSAAVKKITGAPVYYHRADAPNLTRESARQGLRGWLSDLIPELGLLVLFKGILGEATPNAVSATQFVEDGKTVLEDFEVISTPGHTPGHVSYYYKPEKALFAGDALAVVNKRVHFMARPVTEDLAQARASMMSCLAREIDLICPGHREPLTQEVARECRRIAEYLQSGGKWPLLG